jgi:hypothetical protein
VYIQSYHGNSAYFVNVVQHLRDFGRFEMNKCRVRQREDRILVAEEEIFHAIENQPRTSTPTCCKSPESFQFVRVVWLRVQNVAQEIRQNKGILNGVSLFGHIVLKLALQTMAGILSNYFDVSFYTITHNYRFFTMLFKPLLFSE